MICPPNVREAIVDILTTALLRIRSFGTSGLAQNCAIEADHVHNLPQLLREYNPALLLYYWNVERPSFVERISQFENIDDEAFTDAWNCLSRHLHEASSV